MKLLVAGDLHGDIQAAKRLADKAEKENVDLVVLSGDISNFGKNYDGLVGAFVSKGLKTFLIHGNHEDESLITFLSELYNVENLHGKAHLVGDIGFFGCGGANIGYNAMTETEIFETLKKAHDIINNKANKKVMITHVHPAGSIIENFSKFVRGSEGVRKAIKEFQPDILFCSHVHEAEGLEEMIDNTKVFCVGKRSKIIDL